MVIVGGGLLAQLKREILIAPGRVARGNQCLICWLLDKGFNAGTCHHPPAVPIVVHFIHFALIQACVCACIFLCVCVCACEFAGNK